MRSNLSYNSPLPDGYPISRARGCGRQRWRGQFAGFARFPQAQAQLQGQGLARKRVGLVALERIPVRDHTPLQLSDGTPIGEVTSGLLGPTVNEPVAMGYVVPDHAAIGTRLQAMVRGKPVPMEVTAMPFVPARYHRG